MDSDVISMKRNQYIDEYDNVLVTERHDLSNAFIKFKKGHPVVDQVCQNFVTHIIPRINFFLVLMPFVVQNRTPKITCMMGIGGRPWWSSQKLSKL